MKIDYVIPYVDNTDHIWLDQFIKHMMSSGIKLDNVEFAKRFSKNELFRYQFRSMEKFMPWLNSVFLLVQSDSQVPDWINRDTVRIVRHEDFIPRDFLPTYNSGTIECFLHNIPELATCFIYSNDDLYLFNDVQPDDLFDGIMPLVSLNTGVNKTNNQQYDNMCKNMTRFIYKQLGLEYSDGLFVKSKHGHRAFNKVIYGKIYDEFRAYIDSTCTMFRSDVNTTASFFTVYYFLSTGRKYKTNVNTMYLSFDMPHDRILNIFNRTVSDLPQLVCINNNVGDDAFLRSEMDKFFGIKSKYEK